jgi:GINS complex subunit 4
MEFSSTNEPEMEERPSDDRAEESTDESLLPKENMSEELMRHWINERFAPEVLHHQEELLERVLSRIQQQVRTVLLPRIHFFPSMSCKR